MASQRLLDRLDREFLDFSRSLDELGFAPRTLKSITLVLTTACNLRCTYCYADRKGGGSMTWPTARAALDLVHRRGCALPRIFLYGGEPMLRPAMVRRVVDQVARLWSEETRPEVVLCSNGTLLERKTIGWLAENDVGLQLSFDGVEGAQVFRGAGTFGVLDDVLNSMVREFPEFSRRHVTIKLTLSAANLPFLADSIGYLMELGVAGIDVVPLNTHDPYWTEGSSVLLEKQLVAVRAACQQHLRRTGFVPCSLFKGGGLERSGSGAEERMCGFGTGAQVVVDFDGSLVACAALVPSFQSTRGELHGRLLERARLGDIGEFGGPTCRGLHHRQQVESPVFRQKKDKWSDAGCCRDCRYFSGCFVCPVSIAHIPWNNDPHRIPANQCAFNRVLGRQRELFARDLELEPRSADH